MAFKIKLNSISKILKRRGLEEMGKTQKYIDSEVLRLSKPYLPFSKGELEKSGDINTVVGSGKVVYNAPHAAKLYYNPQYNFDTTVNPLAGGMWLERMKADHKQEILEGARKISGAK